MQKNLMKVNFVQIYFFCMWNIIVIIVDLMNYCIKDKFLLVNLVFFKI